MRPVEDTDVAVAWHGLMDAPEKIVSEFFLGRCFEIGGFDAGWVDRVKDIFDGSVFAAGVHTLEQYDKSVSAIGIKELLKVSDATAKLLHCLPGFFFVKAFMVTRVEILQTDRWCDFYGLAHRRSVDN